MAANRLSDATVGLLGEQEVRRFLRELPAEVASQVLGELVKAGAQPILDIAKGLVPQRTRALRESLTFIVRKYPRSGKAAAVIGPARGYFGGGQRLGPGDDFDGADVPANYAHLVEFGHRVVNPRLGGTLRKGTARAQGRVPAKPFLRPAAQIGAGLAVSAMAAAAAQGVERVRRRLVRSGQIAA